MKKFGWYIIATLMTFIFLIGAVVSMVGMAFDWVGDQIINLCHEIERRYWNYEADGYKYEGDGIYTKTYTSTMDGWQEVPDDVAKCRANIEALFASLEADLEAEHNRLTNPTGTVADVPKLVTCSQCIDHYLGGGIHGTINSMNDLCTACHGIGYLSEARVVPAGKAEPQWSTEHLGPGCV